MSAAANKQLMQQVFAELAKGNGKPFVDAMADDFRWTITGTTPWSKTYDGKQTVLNDLMQPLLFPVRGSIHQHGAALHCRRRLRGGRMPRPRHDESGQALQQRLLLCVPDGWRQNARADRVSGYSARCDGAGRSRLMRASAVLGRRQGRFLLDPSLALSGALLKTVLDLRKGRAQFGPDALHRHQDYN